MTVIENLMVPPRGQFGSNLSDRIRALLAPGSNPEEEERLRKYAVLDQLEGSTHGPQSDKRIIWWSEQIVDIGRSMMGDPKLLLLDEPVAGVPAH